MTRVISRAALSGWVILVSGPLANATSTHPQISIVRRMNPTTVTPDQIVWVGLDTTLGDIGADPMRGFFCSDHVPNSLIAGPGVTFRQDVGGPVTREQDAPNAVFSGCTTYRWIFETPPAWPESRPLAGTTHVSIRYRVWVPPSVSPGALTFPGFNWVGMISTQGPSGDHFGFEDSGPDLTVVALGTDSDADRMPDAWESSHGLSSGSASDQGSDSDQDRLAAIDEYRNHTDPENPDTDGDGLPDGWEVMFGTDPQTDDANLDMDGDGNSN